MRGWRSRRRSIRAAPNRHQRAHHRSRRVTVVFALGSDSRPTMAAGAFITGIRRRHARRRRRRLSTRFIIPAPPGTQIVSGHRELAVSADGRQVAFIARGAATSTSTFDASTTWNRTRSPALKARSDPTFSPDGRWLAFHAGNKIRKVSLAGGAPPSSPTPCTRTGWRGIQTEDAIYFAPHQLSALWKVSASGDSPAVAVTAARRGTRRALARVAGLLRRRLDARGRPVIQFLGRRLAANRSGGSRSTPQKSPSSSTRASIEQTRCRRMAAGWRTTVTNWAGSTSGYKLPVGNSRVRSHKTVAAADLDADGALCTSSPAPQS